MDSLRVIIASTFIADPIHPSLNLLLGEAGLAPDIAFAPYGQVFQQLLDPASVLQQNRDGLNAVLIRAEDWCRSHAETEVDSIGRERIEKACLNFLEALGNAASRGAAPQLVVWCPPSLTAVEQAQGFLSEWENRVCSAIRCMNGVQLLTEAEIRQFYPLKECLDANSDRLGHVPYTREFFTALGATLARRFHAIRTPAKKVIVLDCDQTLWKGVCGEVGPTNVEIDESRKNFQDFLIGKSTGGMLLCLCSKNNEEDALAVFEHHPHMALTLEHILSWRINWKPKSENLKALAEELQLGLDSFIFIDDDPVVCAEVQSALPEVFTVQFPPEAEHISRLLRHCWAFDLAAATKEDKARTVQYKQNRERERLRENVGSFEEFVNTLDLRVDIHDMLPAEVARVSQMTFRTNQFNCTTVRRPQNEILQYVLLPGARCLVVEVSDRFGEYGLVGTILLQPHGDELEIDTFLLSCRALGRGVEHRIVAELGRIALMENRSNVSVRFTKSAKNRPAWDFLDAVGSAYYNHCDQMGTFRFPAAVAADLKFQPSKVSSADDSSPTREGSDGRTFVTRARSAGLARIAEDLVTVEQIMNATDSRSLETRPLSAPQGDWNRIELQLLRIWEPLLPMAPTNADDDFFDLGGTSLIAVQVFSQIEKSFDLKLSLATLFEASTIRALARRLTSQVTDAGWSSLVPIQPRGFYSPLFCMHAAGGNVLFYRDLARHLGEQQPVYGLQTRGLHRKEVPHDRVEDMAAHYLGEIRTFQPHGPYYLAGSSFGGLVAWEMAQQLTARGEIVAFLGLLDTYGPGYPRYASNQRSIGARLIRLSDRLANHVRRVRALETKKRVRYVKDKLAKAKVEAVRAYRYKRNEIERGYHAATGKPLPRDLQKTQKAIDNALHQYAPQPYGGKVTLFRAVGQPRGAHPDPFLGWREFAKGEIEVHVVPGHHGAVTAEPYVGQLAKIMKACLEQTQGKEKVSQPA